MDRDDFPSYDGWPRSYWTRYLIRHSGLVGAGAACLLGGLFFLLAPAALELSVVAKQMGLPFSYLWAAVGLIGGGVLIYGILALNPHVEVVGEILTATAILINVVAVLSIRGGGGVVSGLAQLALVAMCACRAWLLVALLRLGEQR